MIRYLPKTAEIFCGLLFMLTAFVMLRYAWVAEDAFITFRVVDNFIHGYGLRWNVDERVQAFTHPLWALLLTPVFLLTKNVMLGAIVLSMIVSVSAVFLVWRFARKISVYVAIASLLFLASSRAVVYFASSGLETPLTYLLFSLIVWLAYTWPQKKHWGILVLCVALSGLNRLDTLLIYTPLLLYFSVKDGRALPIRHVIFGAIPLMTWFMFSLVYYGFFLPNTAYAKLHTGIPLRDLLMQGFYYAYDLFQRDIISVALILIGSAFSLWFIKSSSRKNIPIRNIAFLGCGLFLYCLWVIRTGGDFMFGRFFALPAFGFCVLVPLFLHGASSPKTESFVAMVSALLCSICLVGQIHISGYFGRDWIYFYKGIVDERDFYLEHTSLWWYERGFDLRVNLLENNQNGFVGEGLLYRQQAAQQKGKKYVVVDDRIGMTGYYAGPDVTIIDVIALPDAVLSRIPIPQKDIDEKLWRIGHFGRVMPLGYEEFRRSGNTEFMAPELRPFVLKIHNITAGELFSASRWRDIWDYQLGRIQAPPIT